MTRKEKIKESLKIMDKASEEFDKIYREILKAL
jgi:hypothetical protein